MKTCFSTQDKIWKLLHFIYIYQILKYYIKTQEILYKKLAV